MNDKLLRAGKIVNTHSLRGEVRIYPYCDDAEFLCEFDVLYVDGREMEVVSSRVHKGQALVKFDGINDINHAEALVGAIVCIDRDDVELEEGRYFIEDIKGCLVYDIDTEECYGKVINVIQTGANDVWHIKNDLNEYLIPCIPDVVVSVDIDSEKIIINPLKGIFSDED